jgi:hypothetical protein
VRIFFENICFAQGWGNQILEVGKFLQSAFTSQFDEFHIFQSKQPFIYYSSASKLHLILPNFYVLSFFSFFSKQLWQFQQQFQFKSKLSSKVSFLEASQTNTLEVKNDFWGAVRFTVHGTINFKQQNQWVFVL